MDVADLREIGLFDFPELFSGRRSASSSGPNRESEVLAKTPAAKAAASTDKPAKAPAAKAAASADKPEPAPKQSKKDAKKEAKAAAQAAPAADAPEAPTEFTYLSEEALKKLSKPERGEYHKAKIAYEKAQGLGAPKQVLTKAQRREAQQKNEQAKEDVKQAAAADAEALEEMKMQGLTEEAAREFLAAMAQQDQAAEEEEDDEEEAPQDYLGAVRFWMQSQPEVVPADAVKDFNLKVRFQGHVDTLPPDHLGAIIRNMIEIAVGGCDLSEPKLQPTTLSKLLKPAADRWASMLRVFYSKIDDCLLAVDAILRAVQEGVAATTSAPESAQECAVVGCLMALRALDDMIEDEDLLTGCRRASKGTPVMSKFIEFLEDAVAEDDEEDDEDED